MPVLIPVIQGYLLRAGLPFAISTQGKNGKFLLALSTKTYRDRGGEQSLMLVVTVAEDGEYLKVATCNAYSTQDAKDVGVLCEFLMGQNYDTKLLRWQLDRCDGEIRVLADVAPADGGITYDAFLRTLMAFPLVLDSLHPSVAKVMATAELPAPIRIDKRLRTSGRSFGTSAL